MSVDWRRIEVALREALLTRGIAVGGGADALHFVVATKPPTLPGTIGNTLPTRCPLMMQVGESCGMDCERVHLDELARDLAEWLA